MDAKLREEHGLRMLRTGSDDRIICNLRKGVSVDYAG